MNFEDAAREDKVLTPPPAGDEAAPHQVSHGKVWHRISAEPGYLKAELFGRQTADETRKFLDALYAAALEHRRARILVCVRNSKPIFTVERYGISRYLDIAFKSVYKIALMGDSPELRIAHQYIAMLAVMRGVDLRTFQNEIVAIEWLRSDDTPSQGSRQP
jgi:hypothetical protein